MGREHAEHLGDALAYRLGLRALGRKMDQHQQAGRTFHQSANRRTVSGADDAVSFPVPDLHPVINLGGSISDHRHIGAPATAFQALHAVPAPSPPTFGLDEST